MGTGFNWSESTSDPAGQVIHIRAQRFPSLIGHTEKVILTTSLFPEISS